MHTSIIKPQWSPITIALMVLGFIVFWPLGLAMLGYILWGEKFGGSADRAERWVNRQKAWASKSYHGHQGRYSSASGNAAFDDYRSEQLRRLEDERRRLDDEIEAFHEHMRNLRMARDREEFDRFMAERNAARQGYNDQTPQNGQ